MQFTNAQIHNLNQVVMANSGETLTSTSSSYILNFTLGEVVTETFEISNNYFLTQGFHQPDSSAMTVSVFDLEAFDGQIKIYPNPSNDLINLDIQFDKEERIQLSLFDLSGKSLKQSFHFLKNGIIELQLDRYPAGNYFIEITNVSNRKKQTYKIIKH